MVSGTTVTYSLTGVDLTSVGGGVNETIEFDVEYTAFATSGTGPTVSVFPSTIPGALGVNSSADHPSNPSLALGMGGVSVGGEGIDAEIKNISTTGGLTAATSVEFTSITAFMFGNNTSSATVDSGSEDPLNLSGPAGTGTAQSGSISGDAFTYTQGNQYAAIDELAFEVVVVPEPSTFAVVLGLLPLAMRRRRRQG